MSASLANRRHPDRTVRCVRPKTSLALADRKAKIHIRTSASIRRDVKPACALPDMEYMRKRIPIQDVAQALGLNVNGKAAHCWRIDNHQHSDAKPSIWFTRKNRGRCHVCDSVSWSCIDLVMKVRNISLVAAARWIVKRFSVPNIPKGKQLSKRQRWTPIFRVGTGDTMENFVRSGLLAELTGAEAKVLEVLVTFSEGGITRISYLGIMRYAGIGSPATVRNALKRFQEMHLLNIMPSNDSRNWQACNQYRLTLDDPEFLKSANEIYQRHREEIEAQRSLRAEQTKRSAARPSPNDYRTKVALYLKQHSPLSQRTST